MSKRHSSAKKLSRWQHATVVSTLWVCQKLLALADSDRTRKSWLAQGICCWWKCVNSSTHRLSTATCSHFHLAHVKSGQIRDARPKRDKLASRKTSDFFRDLRLKIGTVPENPGRMVTLTWARYFKFGTQLCIGKCLAGAQIIFPKSGRGLRHVTLQFLAYDRTYLQYCLS